MIRLANRTRVRSARYARYLYPVLFILLDYVAIDPNNPMEMKSVIRLIETGRPVLPLAISYHDETGKHTTGPAFAGEATLIDSLSAVLASRSLIVHLTPSPAIDTKGRTRRDVVRTAHEAIAAALTTRLGFPLSSTAPGRQPYPPA